MNEWMTPADIVLRLVIATGSGVILGLNRDLHDKPAGVRTMGVISLAAASTVLCVLLADSSEGALSRVIQGLLTGIGFVGAGVILHTPGDRRVHGLTTAASTWFAVACGILSAVALWWVLLVAGLLCLAILMFGHDFELRVHRLFGRAAESRAGAEKTPGNTNPDGSD